MTDPKRASHDDAPATLFWQDMAPHKCCNRISLVLFLAQIFATIFIVLYYGPLMISTMKKDENLSRVLMIVALSGLTGASVVSFISLQLLARVHQVIDTSLRLCFAIFLLANVVSLVMGYYTAAALFVVYLLLGICIISCLGRRLFPRIALTNLILSKAVKIAQHMPINIICVLIILSIWTITSLLVFVSATAFIRPHNTVFFVVIVILILGCFWSTSAFAQFIYCISFPFIYKWYFGSKADQRITFNAMLARSLSLNLGSICLASIIVPFVANQRYKCQTNRGLPLVGGEWNRRALASLDRRCSHINKFACYGSVVLNVGICEGGRSMLDRMCRHARAKSIMENFCSSWVLVISSISGGIMSMIIVIIISGVVVVDPIILIAFVSMMVGSSLVAIHMSVVESVAASLLLFWVLDSYQLQSVDADLFSKMSVITHDDYEPHPSDES